MKKSSHKPFLIVGLILLATAFRWAPHPVNFTPMLAVSFFAGLTFSRARAGVFVALAALLLSDMALGFYQLAPSIYVAHLSAVIIGVFMQNRSALTSWIGGSMASGLSFFFISNFAVWMFGAAYPKTLAGLGQCFIAALPFLQNTLTSTTLFLGLLIGTRVLLENRVALIAKP